MNGWRLRPVLVETRCSKAAPDVRSVQLTSGVEGLISTLQRLTGSSRSIRRRIVLMYVVLIAFNVICWGIALVASGPYPILLPSAVLAYTFGLRHAVDADHIAAIDNTTRKLMQDGQRPVGVGLFFSLGHSTVVVAISVLLAITAGIVSENAAVQEIGSLIGTLVSAIFLLVVGLINLVVLRDVWKMFRRVSAGGTYDEQDLDEYLQNRGLIARLLRPALKMIGKSWHMYPLGVLFGLGFDTASEVALLGLAAPSGATHLPVALILLLPALFAAGMSLIDATDGVLMLGAYGWAYIKPIRKLYYNLNITLVSVLIAFVIGGIEILSILSERFGWTGPFWDTLDTLDFGLLGLAIIGLFAISWIVSTLLYRWKRYDELPVRAGSDRGQQGSPAA